MKANNTHPKNFILIGRSGCGKGTQAKLLSEFLKANDPSRSVLYIQVGSELREFIKGETNTQKLTADLYNSGGLMPEFIAVYMWISFLIQKYSGNENLIMDGSPRRYHEAMMLDSAISFYGMNKPHVIHIDISSDEAFSRLIKRKRLDDSEKDIKNRLSWYERDVVPTIAFYKDNPKYNFITINGERTPEEIHKDILKQTGLSGL